MLKEIVLDALNRQANKELTVSLQYLAIAYNLGLVSLPNLAALFHDQSDEERSHAKKFLDYIVSSGSKPYFYATPQPNQGFESPRQCVELALRHEEQVTELITDLVILATEHEDVPTNEFLQWFVTEQVEEVASMRDLLNAIDHAGGDMLKVETYLLQKQG